MTTEPMTGPFRWFGDRWTVVFPGKMGLSWKQAPPYTVMSKAEADALAAQSGNVIAVPMQLFEKMKEHERRMVRAERQLQDCQSFRVIVSITNPKVYPE